MEWSVNWGEIVSIMSSLGLVGSFLIWLYKHLIQKPNQAVREESTKLIIQSEKEQMAQLDRTLQPLSFQIELLNDHLQDSMRDREKIHETLNEHEDSLIEHGFKIKNHEYRLTDLEKLRRDA